MTWLRLDIRSTWLLLVFDVVVLGIFWYYIPDMKRPLDGLCIITVVLGIVTAVMARPSWIKSIAITLVAVAGSVFALEMLEKKFKITNRLRAAPAPAAVVHKGTTPGSNSVPEYTFSIHDGTTWLQARERALRDGADPADYAMDLVGDVFAGTPAGELRIRHTPGNGRIETMISRGVTPHLRTGPLGVELRPDFRFRSYAKDEDTGAMLWDGVATANAQGTRYTKGDASAEAVYVFMGCSFTFGTCLSDWQTLPWQFAAGRDFKDWVINTGVGGNGPHHSLRDLELEYRLDRAGVQPERVRAVYYSYIKDHQRRVRLPFPPGSPRYELENGEAVYQGTFADVTEYGRWGLVLLRSRIFPSLYNRVIGAKDFDEALTLAIFRKMQSICLSRYRIPLHVVDWDGDTAFADKLRTMGIVVIPVSDAFGQGWQRFSVKHFLADGHPTPYANRALARHLLSLHDDVEKQDQRTVDIP